MKKEKVKELTEEMPIEFEVEELIEKLVFIDKVEKRINQLNERKTLANNVVKEKFEEWQK